MRIGKRLFYWNFGDIWGGGERERAISPGFIVINGRISR